MNVREWASFYIAAGERPVRIHPATHSKPKAPYDDDWPNRDYKPEDFP